MRGGGTGTSWVWAPLAGWSSAPPSVVRTVDLRVYRVERGSLRRGKWPSPSNLPSLLLPPSLATGKSTFLRILQESSPSYHMRSEPLTRWLSVGTGGEVRSGSDIWLTAVLPCETRHVTWYVPSCRKQPPSSSVATSWTCSIRSPPGGHTLFRSVEMGVGVAERTRVPLCGSMSCVCWCECTERIAAPPPPQAYACLSRLKAQLEPVPGDLKGRPNATVFFERSVYSDK